MRPGPALRRLLISAALLGLIAAPSASLAQKKPGKPAAAKKAGKGKKKSKRPGKRRGKSKAARRGRGNAAKKAKTRVKTFDFTGLDLAGRLRTPQLIYFLDRAAQELELASLERRSFIPELEKSVDEESL